MISQLEDMKRPKSSHDNFWTKFGNSGHSERSFLSIELELFFLATYYFFFLGLLLKTSTPSKVPRLQFISMVWFAVHGRLKCVQFCNLLIQLALKWYLHLRILNIRLNHMINPYLTFLARFQAWFSDAGMYPQGQTVWLQLHLNFQIPGPYSNQGGRFCPPPQSSHQKFPCGYIPVMEQQLQYCRLYPCKVWWL